MLILISSLSSIMFIPGNGICISYSPGWSAPVCGICDSSYLRMGLSSHENVDARSFLRLCISRFLRNITAISILHASFISLKDTL